MKTQTFRMSMDTYKRLKKIVKPLKGETVSHWLERVANYLEFLEHRTLADQLYRANYGD